MNEFGVFMVFFTAFCESSLAWLKLTEVASALEAIQAEAQGAFESAESYFPHNTDQAYTMFRSGMQDLQDNISNLQLRTANEVKSLENN